MNLSKVINENYLKYLDKILKSIHLLNDVEINNIEITGLAIDSRKVKKGYLFFAYKGYASNGHDYIADAIENGAVGIILDDENYITKGASRFLLVPDARKCVSTVASQFYDHPTSKLKVVGITGTNGKTTIANILHGTFQGLGRKAGLISTIEIKYGDKTIPSALTTPDALSLQKTFFEMLDVGCTHVFMEVSSHALDQGRTDNIDFDGAVFTNLSHDHLDYHESFAEYLKAKKKLFDGLKDDAFALTNIDDKNGVIITQNCKASTYSYGLKKPADYKGKIISDEISGLHMSINGIEVYLRMIGEFNAYNMTAAFAVSELLEMDDQDIMRNLSEQIGARGRMEIVKTDTADYTGIVDYAHTPDALEKVLETLIKIKRRDQNLITIVGAGGNRDKAKRPKMARIASKLGDVVILTSDNPRDEDPVEIINDMMKGVKEKDEKHVFRITERKDAIKMSCSLAKEGDIILIAGKGHEEYQEIKGQRFPFNDKQILSAFMH